MACKECFKRAAALRRLYTFLFFVFERFLLKTSFPGMLRLIVLLLEENGGEPFC